MSQFTNSIRPLETENVLDPRLEAMRYGQENMKWGIFKGCSNQNWQKQQANSYSSAGITWGFNTQSENVLIDRRVYAQCQFQVTITGTSPIGQPLVNDESDAPRAWALGAITQSLKATLNGTSFEGQYADNLEAMLRFNDDFNLRNLDLSQTPSTLDKMQRYQDGVGGVRNPLSTYNNGSYEIGRGAFKLDSIINPVSVDGVTPTTTVIKFTVTEPILLSPFLYSCRDLQSGLYGVSNMGVQYSFKAGQLDRVWSHAANVGVTFTSLTVEIGPGVTAPPQLLINYLNPPLLDSIGEKPRAPVYQYYRSDTYVNDLNQTLPPNASTTVTNNAIQLSTVPQSIYIWVTRPNGDKDYTTTDTAFRINSLSVSYLNVAGQLSTCNVNDLFVISCKNGSNLSWTEFNGLTQSMTASTAGISLQGLTGSFIKLSVEDLAIPDNLASGVNVNSQLQFSINVTNINQSETLGIQTNVMLVYDGVATIIDGTTISQVGILTQTDVVETRRDKGWVDFSKAQRLYGGNFLAKLGSLANNIFEGVEKGAKAAEGAVKLIESGQKLRKAYKGGALMGGARVTADDMRRRLM
jgi:hypothetical protein